MKTCSTCKWYHGYCDRIDWMHGQVFVSADQGAAIQVHVPDDHGLDVKFMVAPDFGCTKHEELVS